MCYIDMILIMIYVAITVRRRQKKPYSTPTLVISMVLQQYLKMKKQLKFQVHIIKSRYLIINMLPFSFFDMNFLIIMILLD